MPDFFARGASRLAVECSNLPQAAYGIPAQLELPPILGDMYGTTWMSIFQTEGSSEVILQLGHHDYPTFNILISFCGNNWRIFGYKIPPDSYEDLITRLLTVAGEIRDTLGTFQSVRHSLLCHCTSCIIAGGRSVEKFL